MVDWSALFKLAIEKAGGGFLQKWLVGEWKRYRVLGKAITSTCAQFQGLDSEDKERIKRRLTRLSTSKEFKELYWSQTHKNKSLDPTQVYQQFVKLTSEFYKVSGIKTDKLVAVFIQEIDIAQSDADAEVKARQQRQLGSELREMRDELRQVRSQATVTVNVDDAERFETRKEHELEYHAIADTALKNIENGSIRNAQKSLLALREELQMQNPSRFLLFRIATLLGNCALVLQELEESAVEFGRAIDLLKNFISTSNMAVVSVLLGQKDKALKLSKQAMSYSNKNATVVAIHLQVLFANKQFNELARLINESKVCTEDPHCLTILGQNAFDSERYDEAEGYARSALEKLPHAPQILQLLAQTLFASVRTRLQSTPIDGKLSQTRVERIREVESLATEVLDILKRSDLTVQRKRAHALRAGARWLLAIQQLQFHEIPDGLEEDVNAILLVDPENQIALYRSLSILVMRNPTLAELSEVSSKINRLELAYRNRLSIKLAEIYLGHDEIEKCKLELQLVEELIGTEKHLHYSYAWLRIRLAEREQTDLDSEVEHLLSMFPEDGDILLVLAQLRRKQGRTDDALRLLSAAKDAPQCTCREWILKEQAEIFNDRGDAEKAIEVLEPFVDTSQDNSCLTEYIVALYRAGRFPRAEELARQCRLRNGGNALDTVSEIEAFCLASDSHGLARDSPRLQLARTLLQQVSHRSQHGEATLEQLNAFLGDENS